ncbi:Vitamin B12 transporter BtuB [Sphingobium sp. AntQ-1]|uniref:TonB-dependent receptor n=1 Tax=Sphingobium sp. AntQ-1 TaxID=2930091 RepID=UPI00234F0685|nr:TonB-dependent receptor plug domain-containing protein [Sphingobium sp. AntQ-1]WCP14005.1 Vitamin B12 transporter BtuB [Sphingobium sp. AntQ-1]
MVNCKMWHAVSVIAMTVSSAAHAQGTPPAAEQSAIGMDDMTRDIVVTARRKAESAQTVPVSITAVGGEDIQKLGLQTTADLQRLVPGVILNGAGSMSNTTYTIRGQGKAVTGPGLPSVITYLNEVPLPPIGSFTPTFDLDNVQVLKGPQGTLFGRNTTGGAVLVYTRTPSYDFEGYAQIDVGNYNKHSVQGAVNIPIIADKLAIRIAGDRGRNKGFTPNISTGKRQDNLHMDTLRASILFEPTDTIKNVLIVDYTRIETNAQGYFPVVVLRPDLQPLVDSLRALGRRTAASTVDPFDNETFWGLSNTTSVDIGAVTIKNIFGYRYTNVDNLQNAIGLPAAPLPNLGPGLAALGLVPGQPGTLITTRNHSVSEQYTNELQISGSLFNDRLSWLAGGFYLKAQPAGVNYLVLDLFRPTPPTPTTQAIVNGALGGVWPVGSLSDTLYGDQSHALFANLSYALDDMGLHGVTLNGGFRYTWDKQSICSNSRVSVALATGETIAQPYSGLAACRADTGSRFGRASFEGSARSKAPTWTLGVDYKASDDIFLYFTNRRGYRAGGLNAPVLAPVLSAFQTFDPQTVTDYEVGVHSKFRSGSWTGHFNIAAFISHFDKLQLQATGITAGSGLPGLDSTNAPAGSALQINAGTATSKGFEFDGHISPTPGLRLSFAGAHLRQKFDRLEAPAILAPFFHSPGGFTGAPKWSYQFAADYEFDLGDFGRMALHGDYYHIDQYLQGPVRLPSYSLISLNAQVSNLQGLPITVTAYVDNLTNRQYIQNIIISATSFGINSGSYAPPRTYGVRVRYDF